MLSEPYITLLSALGRTDFDCLRTSSIWLAKVGDRDCATQSTRQASRKSRSGSWSGCGAGGGGVVGGGSSIVVVTVVVVVVVAVVCSRSSIPFSRLLAQSRTN